MSGEMKSQEASFHNMSCQLIVRWVKDHDAGQWLDPPIGRFTRIKVVLLPYVNALRPSTYYLEYMDTKALACMCCGMDAGFLVSAHFSSSIQLGWSISVATCSLSHVLIRVYAYPEGPSTQIAGF